MFVVIIIIIVFGEIINNIYNFSKNSTINLIIYLLDMFIDLK